MTLILSLGERGVRHAYSASGERVGEDAAEIAHKLIVDDATSTCASASA